MFERSFIESGFIATNGRRRWATLVSMALQTALVAVLILLPLLFTEALPRLVNVELIAPPAPAAARGGGGGVPKARPVIGGEVSGRIREPGAVPTSLDTSAPEPAPAAYSATGTGPVAYPDGMDTGLRFVGVQGGTGEAVPKVVLASRPSLPTPPPEKRVAVSEGVLEGLLIHRVMPAYPELARKARVQGAVLLRAIISREGSIEGLKVTNGHPLLAQAAVDAVRQWRYRPYMLNRQPVEVETEITVHFNLGQ